MTDDSIGTPPGPEVFYWSVSFNPMDYDEHGHRRVRTLAATDRHIVRYADYAVLFL